MAKKYPSLIKEIQILYQQLEQQPTSGISLGKGCYKIRLAIASKNTGKSGGARVITYVMVANETVYLLSIYDKSEQGDIVANDVQSLIKQIP